MNSTLPFELEDIILPNAASFWPLAIGWWLILLIILIIVVALLWRYHYYKTHLAYRKHALRLLHNIFQQRQQTTTTDTVSRIATLLKRVAMTSYSREIVAPLHGKAWVDFLQQQTQNPVFTVDIAKVLEVEQYQQQATVDISSLYQQSSRWIKQHTNGAKAVC